MVDSTDLTAYATIILAIATFLLAYYTHKSVKTSENLAKNTQTQTDIILSQQKPHLTSEITYFTNDLINIDVTNHGPGTAYEIALECNFFITKFIRFNSNDDIDVKDINIKLTDEQRTFFNNRSDDEIKKEMWRRGFIGRYNPIGSLPIYDENFRIKSQFPSVEKLIRRTNKFYNFEKRYPASCIIFLKDTEKRSVWLKSNSSGSFSIKILFGLSNIREDKFPTNGPAFGYHFQGYSFDELKKILTKNGIDSIGVYFHLVCRDTQKKVKYHQTIASFVVDFRTHNSISDALDQKISSPTTLSWKDMTDSTESIPSVMYHNVTWTND